MRKTVRLACAFVMLLAIPGTALADAESDRKRTMDWVEDVVASAGRGTYDLQRKGTFADVKQMPQPGKCLEAVKEAKAKGVKGTDMMLSYHFETYPGKAGGAVAPDVGNSWTLAFSKADSICADYEELRGLVDAVAPLVSYWGEVSATKEGPEDYDSRVVVDGQFEKYVEKGKACKAEVAKVVAGGAPRDVAVSFHGTESLTLDQFETKVCQAYIDWGTMMGVEVKKRKDAKLAALEAEYKKAGAKGDKLAWLVDRGPGIDGWYVKGCKEPKNLKALVKASVWFQWFYPPDGGHTIRRIQFKGNKQVKVTEKTYDTEAKAYKGCK